MVNKLQTPRPDDAELNSKEKKMSKAQKLNSYILLDRSGSMSNRWQESLGSIDSYVEKLKTDGEETQITLAVFDGDNGKLAFDVLRDSVKPADWISINKDEAHPRGMTPLFDAIGRIVSIAENDKDGLTVIVIMTDGAENASRELKQLDAKATLDRCRAKKWEVIFLGADFDNFSQAGDVGNAFDKTMTMNSGSYGATMDVLAQKVSCFRASGSAAAMNFTAEDRSIAKGEKK